MKILVDAHKFDHSFQGTSTYIKGIYNELVKFDDVEITLCAQNIENLKIHFSHPRFLFVKLSSSNKFFRLGFEYPKIIKQGQFDFAHFQYIVPPLKRVKYINTIHDLLFLEHKSYFPLSYRLINGLLFRFSASISDVLLTVSEYSKFAINKYWGYPLNSVIVTNNAVTKPEPITSDNSITKFRKYILYVSRFEPRKNHSLLLQACIENDVFEKGFDLVFVGSKKESIEKKAYEHLIQSIPNHLLSKIHFLESVPDDTLVQLYKNSECFVFPSIAEGFGIPPLEAAILKTKVICSNSTAMQDFNFFKYRFNPNSISELKQCLADALIDQSYPFEEIENKVLQTYSWSNAARLLYDKLMNNFLDEK